jgi:hypothetical protein
MQADGARNKWCGAHVMRWKRYRAVDRSSRLPRRLPSVNRGLILSRPRLVHDTRLRILNASQRNGYAGSDDAGHGSSFLAWPRVSVGALVAIIPAAEYPPLAVDQRDQSEF